MAIPDLLGRLLQIEASHLADADKAMRVMDSGVQRLNPGRKLLGPARTVVAREDFMSVMVALDEAQPGEVLVIDTRGSRRAVLGELFSLEAARRGLAGIVVDGPVRDVVTLRQLTLPVYARSQTPLAGTCVSCSPPRCPCTAGACRYARGIFCLAMMTASWWPTRLSSRLCCPLQKPSKPVSARSSPASRPARISSAC